MDDEMLITVICVFILIMGLVGCGWSIIRAINNIQKEQTTLKKCKSFIENLEKYRKSNDGYKEFLQVIKQEEITSQVIQKEIHGGSPLRTSYVSERFMNILSAVSDKNHVRKAPTVSDLHELTLQREQGGKCVGLFRAITPSILVLGILGTLVGVHGKLGEIESKHISVLASALLPGILAVITTIIMIFLRGWYNKNWSKFITELDDLTVKHILPFFQQPTIISLDIERFTKSVHEILEGKNRLDFRKVAEQLQEYNNLILRWQQLFENLGKKLISDNISAIETEFKKLVDYRERVGKTHERICNNILKLQQLCTSYEQGAATEVAVSNVLLENLPGECSRMMEQLQRDMLHIDSIHNTLALRNGTVISSGFEKNVQEIQSCGKSCVELLEWITILPERIQQHYGNLYNNFESNFQSIQANKSYLEKQLPNFATLPTAYEERRSSLTKHLNNGHNKLQTKTTGLLRTLSHEAKQTHRYQHELDKMNSLYPPGLFGLRMRLFDLVGNLRNFFYRRWIGRAMLLAGLIYFFSKYTEN